jgi:hypothetical protein
MPPRDSADSPQLARLSLNTPQPKGIHDSRMGNAGPSVRAARDQIGSAPAMDGQSFDGRPGPLWKMMGWGKFSLGRENRPLVSLYGVACKMCGSAGPVRARRVPKTLGYFSWVEIELNVLLSLVPRLLTTAISASEMPAAIRPYSMAVAADSSFRNAWSLARMGNILGPVI